MVVIYLWEQHPFISTFNPFWETFSGLVCLLLAFDDFVEYAGKPVTPQDSLEM
jgi:hypothetical protein